MSTRRLWLITGLTVVAMLALQGVAGADDCGSLTDCYNTVQAALAAAAGLAAFLGAAVSMGLDFVPGVGTAKGIYEAITGRDLVTGQEMAWWERGLGILPVAGALIHGAVAGSRALRRGATALDAVADTARATDRMADTARAADRIADTARATDRMADTARATDRMADTTRAADHVAEAADARRVTVTDEIVDVTRAPEGMEIPRERLSDLGYLPEDVDAIKQVAKEYDVDILLRPTNPESVRHLKNGAHPKSMDIKSKTIQDVDLHLNGKLTKDDVGKVGYFDPMPPGTTKPKGMSDGEWTRIQKRFDQRRTEYLDQYGKMRKNAKEGKAFVDERGIVTHPKDGKPYTGDIDVFEVRSRNPDKPLTYEKRVEITDALQHRTDAVQHGAHRDWRYPSGDKVSKGIDEKILASHQPGGETLVRVSPDGNPTAAYFHPP